MTCVLCDDLPTKFWENDSFSIIDAGDDSFPCFVRIIAKRHVAEMSFLTDKERTMLWTILDTVEKTMLSELRPDKVNYAQFGNMVPHLHWHLIARWKDDTHFPECPWGPKQRDVSPKWHAERRTLMTGFKTALVKALNDAEL